MKQKLLLILALLAPYFASKSLAQDDGICPTCRTKPVCSTGNSEFLFEYFGTAEQTNGTTQIKFGLVNYTASPLEYVAFELPDVNLPAVSPVASFISKYHYSVQNTFSDSLIKFTGLNTSTYRYDVSDVFRYQVNTSVLRNGENSVIKVYAKAGEKTAIFTFDLENCGARKTITPLPVVLISFKGTPTDLGVKLDWITASEKNSDYFLVQHSLDGLKFKDIGKVAGNGTVSSERAYRFMHADPANGKNYYRLKQVDLDETSEYSPIVMVEKKGMNTRTFNFAVYPNPVTDGALTISFGKTLAIGESLSVTITDLNGKTVWGQNTSKGQELKLDLANKSLRSGMYLVKIATGNESSFHKVILN